MQSNDASAGPRPIPARGKNLPSPLTTGEQRILLFEDLAPGVPLYNESEAVRLVGELHADALEQAFNLIIARHEVLRSTIQMAADGPLAIVRENWTLRMKRIDLSGLAPADRAAEVERLLIEEPRRPYHLRTEPMLRVTLIRLGPSEHVLILMMHHVFCDWVTEGILWRELSSGYRAICRGEAITPSPLPIQHGDYAAKQQQRVAEGFASELAFWEDNLRGAPELLELPTDRPRPSVLSHRGARQRFRLSASLTEALRNRSRQENASLYTVFAAALNTLLYRYTGSEDLLLGIPIADRQRQELKSVIGFLVHTHALRTKLSGGMTFRELLARMRKGLLALYRRREVPFDQVVNRIQPERSLSHSALFQVMINWRDQENHLSFIGLDGLTVESLMAETRTAKFDMTFFLTDFGTEIWVEVEYSTDLFDDDRIARMFGHYQTLLEAVAVDPDRPLAELPLLTDAERGQLLLEWNSPATEYPAGKCIHELFEEQAELNRDRVAVTCEREQLTYGQLNERANRLAHHLIGLGVGPEVLVGICVERSLEMIVGLLGILKAGGAYAPLDPECPKERLALMLDDAETPILLTQKRLLGRLPKRTARTICLDSDWGEIAGQNPDNPSSGIKCENLAYIIYTSGSTGGPKGVQVTHANVSRLMSATRASFAFDANDVWTMFHSYAFDFSVWEIWGSLLHGGRLVVVPFLTSRSPELFRELLRKEQVTVLNQTPSAFLQQLQSDQTSKSPDRSEDKSKDKSDDELALRLIIFGGEALDFGSLKAWVASHGDEMPQLVNMYGITETTVHVTYLRITDRLLAGGPGSRIGRPISDLQVYILDPHQNPVPIGVAGELYIGGAGLARGYLKRPELNAEKFIPNPFSDRAGSRLYRTGDLGRYLRDGNLEFLGRIDQQVKIRGFRIELEEIEAVLRQHPGVGQCVVVAREDAGGDKQLVSYVVAPPGEPAVSISALRRFIATQLPDYMIPNSFIWLEALPLTTNGKVDRKALPADQRQLNLPVDDN
ncbi:MAG: non-ribosomal peptide synthetase [Candidatus Binataceae bacterium]